MKNVSIMTMLWLLCITLAHGEIPKADLSATPLQASQWPAQYRLTLTVPKDHHAYLDAGDENAYLPIAADPNSKLADSGLSIRKFDKPAGVHDSLVKATVLRDQGDFMLELAQTGSKPAVINSAKLELRYQLCNELTNVCFRPQTAQADLPLPKAALGDSTQSANQPDETASFMDKLVTLFNSQKGNMAMMFALMFMAGLLSVATPCVYPMLPITSMFIVGRANGDAAKEKHHASAYFAGMITTYMALGLIAGMTGGAFNSFMQSAAVNLGFAIFFAFFALALLGFYELSFMQNEVLTLDQQSSQVKGISGTFLMGCVAGLVISPCVGPIVFALLLQVADNIADKAAALASINQSLNFWGKLAIASQGSLMMGGFGLGVGLPFFAVSVVKFKKMPKAGYWMNKVKYAFGFMILYFAYTYLQKGMGVMGVEPATTNTIAAGLVAIWIAVVHCQVLSLMPTNAQPNEKMQHYVGVLSMIVGGWMVIAGLGKIPLINQAQAQTFANSASAQGSDVKKVSATEPVQTEAGIAWYRNFDAAKKVAQESGKPIFIDFYASWCANCTEFKKETVSNEQLNQALREKAIAVKLVDQEPDFEKFRASQEHRPLKIGLPYFAIITPNGKVAWSGTDYKATQKMIAELNRLS